MKDEVIKSKIRMILFTVLFFSICLFFTLWPFAKDKAMSNVNAVSADPSAVTTQQESTKVDLYVQEEKVIESWDEFNASNLPLISAIPERSIYLYAIKPSGVVLYVEGSGHYFDWSYITPRFILPKMHVGDFDNDGKEELSIILYVGSGTGYAVEELHIVEISEDDVLSREPSSEDYFAANPEYFADYYYNAEEYISKLNELVKFKAYDNKKGELEADIRLGDELYTISLKQLQSKDVDITINDAVCFGNIVYFNVKDEKLTAEFALGVTSDSHAAPVFIGDVYAEVSYNKGKFMISNLRFEPDEEYPSKYEGDS